jgi:hypothetical protein
LVSDGAIVVVAIHRVTCIAVAFVGIAISQTLHIVVIVFIVVVIIVVIPVLFLIVFGIVFPLELTLLSYSCPVKVLILGASSRWWGRRKTTLIIA